jgi:hypothetical protein
MGRQTGSGASFAVRRRWRASLSVGACCLQARVGSFSSVGGCCVCGWASRWGLFSSVGGCCVRGRSRSEVGVALGVVLVGGGLLHPRALAFVGGGRSCQWGVVASVGARVQGWASRSGSFSSVGCCYGGGFVVVGGFRVPVAGVVHGRSSFVGGGRSSGVDDGGGVVLARSGCDVALPRRC